MCRRLLSIVFVCLVPFVSTAFASDRLEDFIGETVVEVKLAVNGQIVEDASVNELIETQVGQPLSMRHVRESLTHLYSLGRFGGVKVDVSSHLSGVTLQFDLSPLDVIGQIDFRGQLGLPVDELRRTVEQAYGLLRNSGAIEAVSGALRTLYRRRGFLRSHIDLSANGSQIGQRLVFDIDAGRRARVARVSISGVSSPALNRSIVERLGLTRGTSYDGSSLDERLLDYEAELRDQGYFEASFSHDMEEGVDGETVNVLLNMRRGPRVSVAFSGDSLSGIDIDELVQVEREGSVNEDLLEDSGRAITEHLQRLGYRDAVVSHERVTEGDALSIVFDVSRGELFEISEIIIRGNVTIDRVSLASLLGINAGDPLVMRELDGGLDAIVRRYNQLGFTTAAVTASVNRLAADGRTDSVAVSCELEVTEGAQTFVRSMSVEGNVSMPEAFLESEFNAAIGRRYFSSDIEASQTLILARYLNEGYEQASVSVERRFDDSLNFVDVVFRVHEGVQVLVDHILIIGNQRVSSQAIRRETTLRIGRPLGLDEVAETRRRLNALGMFRRVDIREFSHGRTDRRDVIIEVEEAPATVLSYGGGLEVSQRLRRRTGTESSQAVERIELAPRGFFEIGRRHLFGKNRSINLFTRASVRRKNDPIDPVLAESTTALGFNEYRMLATYREPRTFGLGWDVLIQGHIEQAIRPGFDLFSRGGTAQFTRQSSLTDRTTFSYRLGKNDTTNRELNREDSNIVDRLFPDVRLSSFSGSHVRDTRDDPFEPRRGSLLGIDTEVALRAVGSEVGFSKTFLQGFIYRSIADNGRLIFAGGARLGMAWRFPYKDRVSGGVLDDLVLGAAIPISERFFAGGDTTIRGFALDRLGAPIDQVGGTVDEAGFPQGGHAVFILNGEFRVRLTRSIGFVTFLDVGNVFHRVSHLDVRRLRAGTGFGIRYASPLGPIRVDLGFKLGERHKFGCGETLGKECLTAVHISIGQAF